MTGYWAVIALVTLATIQGFPKEKEKIEAKKLNMIIQRQRQQSKKMNDNERGN